MLRRHRARCRPRHPQSENQGGAGRGSLSRLRPENLDLDGAGREQNAAPRPHRSRRRREENRGLEPFLHRSRPPLRRSARDREDGPQGRRLEPAFLDKLPVPAADRIGEEGQGFACIIHGFNPERILIAAEAVGLGRAALKRAVGYAKERVVFGRPIGKNQAIQHPLAKCWMELEAANLMVFRAAALYDDGKPVRGRGQCRQIPRRRGLLFGLRDRGADPRRHGLRQGIPRRAVFA